MDQISFALKEFGFGTRIYSFDAYGKTLYEIIDSYIESGIPIIVGLQSGNIGHVIVAIGKEYGEEYNWTDIKDAQVKLTGEAIGRIETSSIPAKYVVQDDNLIPYRLIHLAQPGEHYEDEDCTNYTIDSIVVPLYSKIYLEAVVAKELAIQVIEDGNVGYDFGSDYVFRFYLTSSRSLKNHVAKIADLNNGLKSSILLTKMPKFVWCGEIYTQDGFEQDDKKTKGIVILDATEANQESIDALIFAGYPDRCVILNENNYVILQHGFQNFRYFDNLK